MAKRQTANKIELTENLLKKIQLKPKQQDYIDQIFNNEITFCSGPAGTSKTFSACYASLSLLAQGKIKQVVLCKPIQEAGEKLGFLPGDINEKVEPYIQSYVSSIRKIVGDNATKALFEKGAFTFKPLAFMRGDTFDNSLMILDEAQNATFKQLVLFITRMGRGSKVVITGDISQYDIPKQHIGLPGFINLMQGIHGIGHHVFTEDDIVRAKILQDIVKRYEKWKQNHDS